MLAGEAAPTDADEELTRCGGADTGGEVRQDPCAAEEAGEAVPEAGEETCDWLAQGATGELLLQSWEAARRAGLGADPSAKKVPAQQWLPFDKQIPVTDVEKVFLVSDHVYLASEFGASCLEVFDILGIQAVINITNGDRKVPNHFAESRGVEYTNFELADQPGENIFPAVRSGTDIIARRAGSGEAILVHCSAGLSRSATVVVAWLMLHRRWSLAQAFEHVCQRRGRRLQVNPSFWMTLAAWERELFELPAGTTPSFDFRQWWLEDFGRMGFPAERIEAALSDQDLGDWVHFERAFQALLA